MSTSRGAVGARTWLLLATALALVVATVVPAPAHAQAPGCPTPVPASELESGQLATGLTVERGQEPTPFDVEILGVLDDAVAPGRDIIVVEVSGELIDRHGGIWAGMSGSPVTLDDGRLVGALAYGFSVGPSRIGGLTPAEDMLDLLDGDTDPTTLQRASVTPLTGRSAELAAASDPRADEAGRGLAPLQLPVSVSGAGPRGVELFQEGFDRAGLPFIAASAGAAAAAAQAEAPPPEPGGNLAATLSVGDLTTAAVGTTTAVCDGKVVAFGHPFFFDGPDASFGAHRADALTVVDDPTFGPYKLANVAGGFGAISQDRLAGVSGPIGELPDATPVTSVVTDQVSDDSREGRTDVFRDEAVPSIAPFHLLANLDVVLDRIGEGTSELAFTVTGEREDGREFTVERENRFGSEFDIAIETVFESLSILSALEQFPGEEISFTGVDYDATVVDDEFAVSRIGEVLVGVDGAEPAPVPQEGLAARPGSQLEVRVTVLGPDGGEEVVELSVEVPPDAVEGGGLVVSGGGGGGFFFEQPFFFDPGAPANPEDTDAAFEELLESIENLPTNDELVARVDAFSPFPPEGTPPARRMEESEARADIDRLVQGEVFIPLLLPAELFVLERIAGPDRIATSVSLSARSFPSADTVVLTRGDVYADALAGAPLAAELDGPVILTDRFMLREDVAAEITRLGAEKVVLLGGPVAITDGVVAGLTELGVEVERVNGENRFETAAEIARRVGGDAAYVVQGIDANPDRGWPDALSVSGLAALQGRPILLVTGGEVPDATLEVIRELEFSEATIVGGTVSVADGVQTLLGDLGLEVDRIAGADRYETSILVAQRAIESGAARQRTVLTAGGTFADALSAGAAVGQDLGVLLLVDGQNPAGSPSTYGYLDLLARGFQYVRVLGGDATIRPEVFDAIALRLFPPPPPEPPPPPPHEPVPASEEPPPGG